MTKLKEVDPKPESESDRRQHTHTQKAKIFAKVAICKKSVINPTGRMWQSSLRSGDLFDGSSRNSIHVLIEPLIHRVLASFWQPDSDIMWNDTKGTMEVPPVSSTGFRYMICSLYVLVGSARYCWK